MRRTSLALVLAWLALGSAGCEIVADFDRSLIPEPDGGSAPPDGSLVPDAGGAGNGGSGGGDGAVVGPDQDAGEEDAGS